MADQRNDVIFYKVDVENEPGEIDTEFNVSFVPLFVLIKNGKRVSKNTIKLCNLSKKNVRFNLLLFIFNRSDNAQEPILFLMS